MPNFAAMNIVVNARFLQKDLMEGIGYFTREVFTAMATQHPEHQFHFVFDRPTDPAIQLPKNVQTHVVGPPARATFLWKFWFDYRIPSLLRKLKADVFVSPDGYASLRTRVPQCIVVHDLGYLHMPEAYRRAHQFFFRRYVPRFVKKAKVVATVSEFSKQDIIRQYGTADEKIRVVKSAVKQGFQPLSYEMKQEVKERFTAGHEYFIYVGAIQPRKNLVNLLKAFSQFKKRQQSAFKLVLAGRLAWKNNEFLELLKTYKYREDVILTGYLDQADLQALTAAAYALVYPSFFEGFGVPVLEGMQSGVPVLTSRNSSMEEIGGAAALYFDPHDPAAIAEQLMRIYKDEDLRNRLITSGREIAPNYSWEHTARLMWDCVEATVRS